MCAFHSVVAIGLTCCLIFLVRPNFVLVVREGRVSLGRRSQTLEPLKTLRSRQLRGRGSEWLCGRFLCPHPSGNSMGILSGQRITFAAGRRFQCRRYSLGRIIMPRITRTSREADECGYGGNALPREAGDKAGFGEESAGAGLIRA